MTHPARPHRAALCSGVAPPASVSLAAAARSAGPAPARRSSTRRHASPPAAAAAWSAVARRASLTVGCPPADRRMSADTEAPSAHSGAAPAAAWRGVAPACGGQMRREAQKIFRGKRPTKGLQSPIPLPCEDRGCYHSDENYHRDDARERGPVSHLVVLCRMIAPICRRRSGPLSPRQGPRRTPRPRASTPRAARTSPPRPPRGCPGRTPAPAARQHTRRGRRGQRRGAPRRLSFGDPWGGLG